MSKPNHTVSKNSTALNVSRPFPRNPSMQNKMEKKWERKKPYGVYYIRVDLISPAIFRFNCETGFFPSEMQNNNLDKII